MTRAGRARATAAAVLAAVALVLAASSGAGAAPQDVANDVAQSIMSPYCPGVTLHDCPSEEAIEMRDRIVGWAEAGWSKERIIDHLEEQFGDAVRATPPARGAGLVAWLLPAVLVVGGLGLGGILATRWRSPERVGMGTLSEAERARVAAELDAMRSEQW